VLWSALVDSGLRNDCVYVRVPRGTDLGVQVWSVFAANVTSQETCWPKLTASDEDWQHTLLDLGPVTVGA
jgi:hypothetical protein